MVGTQRWFWCQSYSLNRWGMLIYIMRWSNLLWTRRTYTFDHTRHELLHQKCAVRLLRSIWGFFWLHLGNTFFFCKQQHELFVFLQICCQLHHHCHHLLSFWGMNFQGEVEAFFPLSCHCKYLFICVCICVSENITNVLRFILDNLFFFFTSNVNMSNIPCWNFLVI